VVLWGVREFREGRRGRCMNNRQKVKKVLMKEAMGVAGKRDKQKPARIMSLRVKKNKNKVRQHDRC